MMVLGPKRILQAKRSALQCKLQFAHQPFEITFIRKLHYQKYIHRTSTMKKLKLSVRADCLRIQFEDALKFTADHGCEAIQPGYNPAMDSSQRRQYLQTVKSYGLAISAICAWGGEVDLGNMEGLKENIETGKRILEYTIDMECGIWQGHCGVMPHHREDPKWARFIDSFGQLCVHAEKLGARIAIETGPEPPEILLDMINDVASPALCVNYDPANLIIWPAFYAQKEKRPVSKEEIIVSYKPVEGVKTLGQRIIHTHAKDALVIAPNQPKEVPLGEGWIDWPKYIQNYRDIGFDGYFAIEREVGADPLGDTEKAIEFLQSLN